MSTCLSAREAFAELGARRSGITVAGRRMLVDEFQGANIAQIELLELLGRTPDRPDNVMVVGDDDQP
jgi:superfamily I DNA/RNA helicase